MYESNWYHGGYDVSPRTSRLKGNLVEQHDPYRGHIVVVGQWREGQGGRIPVAYIDALRATGGVPKLVSTFDPGPGEEVPTDVGAAMGLDDDDPCDPGANLHEGVRDSVEPILSEGVHGLLHSAELVGGVLVENRYAFIEVFGAGDEGIDLARLNSRIEVGLLGRLEHQFFEREMRR